MFKNLSLGKTALLVSMAVEEDEQTIRDTAVVNGYKIIKGRVGAMDSSKIFAAIETAAKKERLIESVYRQEHALYHSVLEAYEGICRGQVGLGNVLRTAGLVFSVAKGSRLPGDTADGDWLAVVLYGNMGAPIKGFEHEVIGLGMNPV